MVLAVIYVCLKTYIALTQLGLRPIFLLPSFPAMDRPGSVDLTWDTVLVWLQDRGVQGAAFRLALTQWLRDAPWELPMDDSVAKNAIGPPVEAFFLEFSPLAPGLPFSFACVDATHAEGKNGCLPGYKTDAGAFNDQLLSAPPNLVFPSLNNSSMLVCPEPDPGAAASAHAHMAAFVKFARSDIVDRFWQRLGDVLAGMIAGRGPAAQEVLERNLNESIAIVAPVIDAGDGEPAFPIWVLTDGYSVKYLHIHAKIGPSRRAYTKFRHFLTEVQ